MGRARQGERDAMLEGVCMTPGNRHTYTTFVENDLICSEWGGGGLRNI